MKTNSIACLAVGSAFLSLSCVVGTESDDPAGDEVIGRAVAEISSVPPGVACVRLILAGSANSTKTFSVTAGTTPVTLSLGNLPSGALTVTPAAFSETCASLTAVTVPSWVGPDTVATITPGITTSVKLTLVANLPVTATVNFLQAAQKVALGRDQSYVLLSDGTVRAWGDNSVGQLGNGSTTDSLTPVVVSSLSGVTAIDSGMNFGCAISNGQARCWGANDSGQLGNGTTMNSSTPVVVSGSSGYQAVALGGAHSCALKGSTPFCWGNNFYGQLANGGASNSTAPVAAASLGTGDILSVAGATTVLISGPNVVLKGRGDPANASALASGRFLSSYGPWTDNEAFSCVSEAASGAVLCLGNNTYGQLGNGTTVASTVPVSTGLTGAGFVDVGYGYACALKSNGSVWCWGNNTSGAVGDGTSTHRSQPTAVKGLSAGVVHLSVGQNHACAVKSDGSVWCWGANSDGQLGDGTTITRGSPTQVVL